MNDEPLRRAALLIHGLGPRDREWLLRSLGEAGRTQLDGLLKELKQLGMPHDDSLVQQVLTRSSKTQPSSHPLDEANRLALADHRAMFVLLADEPTRFIAALLDATEWPWTEALMESLGPERAIALRERSRASAPALVAATLRAVSNRLAAQPLPQPPGAHVESPPRRHLWKRIGVSGGASRA